MSGSPHRELAYLDFCATTPVEPEIAEVVMRYMVNDFGNPGSRTHQMGSDAKRAVENARREVASALGFDPSEIVFTSGATESNNLAILGLADYGQRTGRMHLVTTQIEHKSVLEPCHYLESLGFAVTYIAPGADGAVRAENVLSAVREDTLLVSIMNANNEIGTLQPVHEIQSGLDQSRALLHVDAAQTFAKIPKLEYLARADLVSISGHKIGAPKGIGALAVNRGRQIHRYLKPLMYGGGQELALRPGTVPTPLVAGLGMAASHRIGHLDREYELCKDTKLYLLALLANRGFPVIGDPQNSLPNCVCVDFSPIDAEAIFVATRDSHCVSNGSACTSASRSRSHVLTAMGLSEVAIDCSIRISWNAATKRSALDRLITIIASLQ